MGCVSSVTVCADAENKELVVGFDAEYPPFGYMDDNGEYVGFDLDTAQKVCDNLGWELVEKTNQLGFQRHGIKFWKYRLYLEWIYHERT